MDNELYHYGRKGMKWYQNIFTKGKNAESSKKGKKDKSDSDEETVEQKRARLLKSTDASEIYKHRDILTTQEIKERLDRIDTERRLSEVSERSKKTGMDRVNTALKWGNKMSEVYNFTQTPMMKALKKKLSGETDEEKSYSVDLKKAVKNLDKISDDQLNKMLRRVNSENALKKLAKDLTPEDIKEVVDEIKEEFKDL